MKEDEVGHTDDVLRVSLLPLLLLDESSHFLLIYYVSYMPLLFLFGSPINASLFQCYLFSPLFDKNDFHCKVQIALSYLRRVGKKISHASHISTSGPRT